MLMVYEMTGFLLVSPLIYRFGRFDIFTDAIFSGRFAKSSFDRFSYLFARGLNNLIYLTRMNDKSRRVKFEDWSVSSSAEFCFPRFH